MHPTHGAVYQWLVTSSITGLLRVALSVMSFDLLADIRKGYRHDYDLLVLFQLALLLVLSFFLTLTTLIRLLLSSIVLFTTVVVHKLQLRQTFGQLNKPESIFAILCTILLMASFLPFMNQFFLLQLFLVLILLFTVYHFLTIISNMQSTSFQQQQDVSNNGSNYCKIDKSSVKLILYICFISLISILIGTCFCFYNN